MHPRIARLLEAHPAPWTYRLDPVEGIVVKDGRGELVSSYSEDDEAFAAGLCESINHSATCGPFLADVVSEMLSRPRVEGMRQVWLHLDELVSTLRHEMDRPHDKRRASSMRDDLVRLAAVAWRGALDLGMESKAAAVSLDIPF